MNIRPFFHRRQGEFIVNLRRGTLPRNVKRDLEVILQEDDGRLGLFSGELGIQIAFLVRHARRLPGLQRDE